MAWCFSTRASIATVLTTHPCASWCLRVKGPAHMVEGGHHFRKAPQPPPTRVGHFWGIFSPVTLIVPSYLCFTKRAALFWMDSCFMCLQILPGVWGLQAVEGWRCTPVLVTLGFGKLCSGRLVEQHGACVEWLHECGLLLLTLCQSEGSKLVYCQSRHLGRVEMTWVEVNLQAILEFANVDFVCERHHVAFLGLEDHLPLGGL